MAIILSIETATDVCSVAISENNQLIKERTLESGRRHSSALTSLIKLIVLESGYSMSRLSCVALSDGPGSYTGLRVGASTAKGICYALDIPLIVVPTLQAMAFSVLPNKFPVMSTIDARRMEVYAAIYSDVNQEENVYSLIFNKEAADEIVNRHEGLIITGNGIAKGAHLFEKHKHILIQPQICKASLLVPIASRKYDLGQTADIAYHTPFYFKAPNITTSRKEL